MLEKILNLIPGRKVKKELKRKLEKFADHGSYFEICSKVDEIRKNTNYHFAIDCVDYLTTLLGERASLFSAMLSDMQDLSERKLAYGHPGFNKKHNGPYKHKLNQMFKEEYLQLYSTFGYSTPIMQVVNGSIVHFDDKLGENVAMFFKKYRGKLYRDFLIILREHPTEVDFEELLSDKGYDEVKKNGLKSVALKHYSLIRKNVREHSVLAKLSYPDMDSISKAYNAVMAVHRERKTRDRNEITEGFFAEMNRAISQGTDTESKIQMLKTYGRDVQDKMKTNAGELMYSA